MPRINMKKAVSQEPTGIKDGGHEIIKCSGCGKSLVDIWITRPLEDFSEKFIADCPYCGDRSFVVTIEGGFHIGGFMDKTVIEGFVVDPTSGVQVIKVIKNE